MAANDSSEGYWQGVYGAKDPTRVSWFEPVPETSLELIAAADLRADAAILDAGGGTSGLAGELLHRGYTDVTVADVSAAAIERAAAALGEDAQRIHWVQADLRKHRFERRFDLWHDRAVFHFMVEEADRDGYLAALRSAVRPGGHLVLATFGPRGPSECSGLPTRRYGAEQLAALLPDFRLRTHRLVDHRTPAGAVQQFLYAHFRRLARSIEA